MQLHKKSLFIPFNFSLIGKLLFLDTVQARRKVWNPDGAKSSDVLAKFAPLPLIGIVSLSKFGRRSHPPVPVISNGFYTDISNQHQVQQYNHVWSHFYKILVVLKWHRCLWANIFDTDISRCINQSGVFDPFGDIYAPTHSLRLGTKKGQLKF